MKAIGFISFMAFVVLGAAAVWMGSLNQDEGWYLYAANLVAEGRVPYRDFFFTQGPMMPYVYSCVTKLWASFGLLGARVFTLVLGAAGIGLSVALSRRLAPEDRRTEAATMTFLLLGCNLYHLYYLAIPKTYALASLFVAVAFYMLSVARERRPWLAALAGLALAFAAGTRISLGALLATTGLWLAFSRRWKLLTLFAIGGAAGLGLLYAPFLFDAPSREGLLAAQSYHAARGGSDIVWTVGSLSRLVRWYLAVFVAGGMCVFGRLFSTRSLKVDSFCGLLLLGFAAVFAVQMLAPFPYEDYQVPIMGLLSVASAVGFVSLEAGAARAPALRTLLVLGMVFAGSFGSPLLEKWSTNGQDRFWSLKKEKYELAQLKEVAKRIESLDPGGKELLTQDLYLAIETGRKVPSGLEMGPFSMLSDREWRTLLSRTDCRIAALSGYTFAIEPPSCKERPIDRQMEYWELLKRNFELVERHDAFGQNATPLLVLRHK